MFSLARLFCCPLFVLENLSLNIIITEGSGRLILLPVLSCKATASSLENINERALVSDCVNQLNLYGCFGRILYGFPLIHLCLLSTRKTFSLLAEAEFNLICCVFI